MQFCDESHKRWLRFCGLLSLYPGKGKGKAVPLQAWSGPRGLQEVTVLRLHDKGTGWW